jgi:D-aminopeptidase
MVRARDLGIVIGQLPPGELNAITDVPGVRVGHATLIRGDGPLRVGEGPARTGVTVIFPHEGDPGHEPVFAGDHVLNGNGEMTGLLWLRECGMLTTPIGLTNTHSVGTVHEALVAASTAGRAVGSATWALPVVAETWDGYLNDIDGQHVRREHVLAAIAAASDGPVTEGNVGGGTGMKAFGFKAGIGTASRVVASGPERWTLGALVQANHGIRERLTIDGVPVGREIGRSEIPGPDQMVAGSIIVIIGTDAPLLPHQCRRLAQRASLGVARGGGGGESSSGDLMLAFAIGNRGLSAEDAPDAPRVVAVRTVHDDFLDDLHWAAIEATEEAILNALLAAETMTGRDGTTFHALPHDRLVDVMRKYGRMTG